MDKEKCGEKLQNVIDNIQDKDEKERFISFVKKQINVAMLFSNGNIEMLECYSKLLG